MKKDNISIIFEKEKLLLRMSGKCVIRGRLLDANGLPVSQVKVIAQNFDPAYYQNLLFEGTPSGAIWQKKSVTTLDGAFEISGLYGGGHKLYIEKNRRSWVLLGEIYLKAGYESTIGITLPAMRGDESNATRSETLNDSHVCLDLVIDGNLVNATIQDGRRVIYPGIGKEYSIKITNKWSEKLLAVLTVDGLSVMNGTPGGFDSAGYVMPSFRALTIPGWRLNDTEVAKFVFQSEKKSYASLIHIPENIGVIACAFFEEESQHKNDEDLIFYSRASRIGTGFGDRSEHKVTLTKFLRKNKPSIIKTIYYVANTGQAANKNFNPDPFPGCQPPPGWQI